MILGSWTAATSAAGYIGANYLSDDNTGKGTKSVKYTPNIIAAANYNVYIRYTSGSNRATNVPIDIVHSWGTDLLSLDQRTRGGAWVLLGRYSFAAGTSGSVTIGTAGTTGFVIADALRFQPY